MPDEIALTHLERGGETKTVTPHEIDSIPNLLSNLQAKGWSKITEAKAAKLAQANSEGA